MNSSNAPLSEELFRLCEKLASDEISDEEARQMERLALADPSFMRQYVVHLHFQSFIERREASALPLDLERLPPDLERQIPIEPLVRQAFAGQNEAAGQNGAVASSQAVVPAKREARFGGLLRRRGWLSLGAAVSAVLFMLAVMAYLRMPQHQRGPVPPTNSSSIVAHVTGAVGCDWEGDRLARGAALSLGREIGLREGIAQITFESGAVVLLEGPVRFSPLDKNSAYLRRGKLVARVGKNASGFAVEAPGVRIVDLGTEFGLKVDDTGTVDLHVFDGKVAAFHQQPNDARPQSNDEKRYDVTEGERLRFLGPDAPERSKIDPAERGEFARTLPPLPPGAEIGGLVHHWTFNDGTARDLVGKAHGTLLGEARIESGRLLLDGVSAYVRTEPSEHQLAARTLVVWVKPENTAQCAGGVCIVQGEQYKETDWGIFDGVVYGELVAGQWMNGSNGFQRSVGDNGGVLEFEPTARMIAITYNDAGGIALYRDNRFYARRDRASKGSLITYPAGETRFLFGLRHESIVNQTGMAEGNDGYFAGWVDEARVYNRALSSSEILALHLAGPVPHDAKGGNEAEGEVGISE